MRLTMLVASLGLGYMDAERKLSKTKKDLDSDI